APKILGYLKCLGAFHRSASSSLVPQFPKIPQQKSLAKQRELAHNIKMFPQTERTKRSFYDK
ncbi:MAG: hypothetical protein J5700_01835, partial [Treponema sp.]|nr:hypothetical protein [Treponema sp.]